MLIILLALGTQYVVPRFLHSKPRAVAYDKEKSFPEKKDTLDIEWREAIASFPGLVKWYFLFLTVTPCAYLLLPKPASIVDPRPISYIPSPFLYDWMLSLTLLLIRIPLVLFLCFAPTLLPRLLRHYVINRTDYQNIRTSQYQTHI